jgi:hypothetical protein
MYSFKKAKSLCPDGWIVEFYFIFCDMLKDDFSRVIYKFRTWRNILGALNATIITLIPNKNDLDSFLYCRPISLCNSIYKIITNILANRLKNFLSWFIS